MPRNPDAVAHSPEKETITPNVNHFRVLEQIGKGAYSTIHVGLNINGEKLAVKVMDVGRYKKEFSIEVEALEMLKGHNGIVQIHHSEMQRRTGFIYMDFLPYPTLHLFVMKSRCLPQDTALNIFWDLLLIIEHIHLNGIAHRDIKPENMMIDPETLKITILDFGLSVFVPKEGLVENYGGSPMYMAPEVLSQKKHNPQIADMWSAGVILYFMLVGDSPWSSVESMDDLLDLVIFETTVLLPLSLSGEVRELLSAFLTHDPSDRISLANAQEKLQSIGQI